MAPVYHAEPGLTRQAAMKPLPQSPTVYSESGRRTTTKLHGERWGRHADNVP